MPPSDPPSSPDNSELEEVWASIKPAPAPKPVKAPKAKAEVKKPPQIDREAERRWLLDRTKRAMNELLSKDEMSAAEHQAFSSHVDKIAKLTGAYAPTVATINTPDMAQNQATARALLSELFVENGALMAGAQDKLNAETAYEGGEETPPDDPPKH